MKTLSIINPVSGTKKAVSIFHKLLKNKSLGLPSTPYITQYDGHASEIIRTIDLSPYQAIVVFGGDGTIHEVIHGMLQREDKKQCPIGVLPLGTGNALMHHLGLLTVDQALDRIQRGQTKPIDLLECKTSDGLIYSFNMVGWGIPVTINDKAEQWRIFGKQRYNIASIRELLVNPSWPCTITVDDMIIKGDITFFMTCNTQYTGNGMHIAPTATLDSGKMEVIILRKQSRLELIRLFVQVFSGKHIDHPHILYQSANYIKIETGQSMPLIIDGQQTGNTPVEIKVLPKKLSFIV